MLRKLNYAAAVAWLLSFIFILRCIPAFAEPPAVEQVLGVLGMDKSQVAELVQGQPVTYALSESRSDELAMGIVWYLPVPLAKVVRQLRHDDPDPLDIGVTAHGLLTEHGGAASLAPVVLPGEEAEALLDSGPSDKFNLSVDEIDSFETLKKTFERAPQKAIEDSVGKHYREILFRRFAAYKRGGLYGIAPYAREEGRDSKPSQELRQAASSSAILQRYFPAVYKAWLDYPKPLPPGAGEAFPWVQKEVENRPAVILKHRISIDWDGGVLILIREFYAPHSYNSSQWITGCLPYHDGTVVFQQLRSYTDQVAGLAGDVKHIIGREFLKDNMLKSFERFCDALDQCH